MSDGGRMSIKSRGSPPTPPYSNMLNSSSANMWTLVDCYVYSLLHDCVHVNCHLHCLFPFFWTVSMYTVCDQQDITVILLLRRSHAVASVSRNKTVPTLQMNNGYYESLEMTLVLTNICPEM